MTVMIANVFTSIIFYSLRILSINTQQQKEMLEYIEGTNISTYICKYIGTYIDVMGQKIVCSKKRIPFNSFN